MSVKWEDNKRVWLASEYDAVHPTGQARRFEQTQKKHPLRQPAPVKEL